MSKQPPPGKEPTVEYLRLRDLIRWLPYSKKEILQFIDAGIIRGKQTRRGGRNWYLRTQVKRRLGV